MKGANIDREIIHIFWAAWGISMKFSGKMWSTISLEDTFFEKQGGLKLTP